MQKIVDYKIVTIPMQTQDTNPAAVILREIKDGWEPLGNVNMMLLPLQQKLVNSPPQAVMVYTQAMVKYEDVYNA